LTWSFDILYNTTDEEIIFNVWSDKLLVSVAALLFSASAFAATTATPATTGNSTVQPGGAAGLQSTILNFAAYEKLTSKSDQSVWKMCSQHGNKFDGIAKRLKITNRHGCFFRKNGHRLRCLSFRYSNEKDRRAICTD